MTQAISKSLNFLLKNHLFMERVSLFEYGALGAHSTLLGTSKNAVASLPTARRGVRLPRGREDCLFGADGLGKGRAYARAV